MGLGMSLGPEMKWAGTRDLCRSGHESGTSEGVGLRQDLCETNFMSGTSAETNPDQENLQKQF